MWTDLLIFFFLLHVHATSVCVDVMAGWGFGVKGLRWSWECGKPPPVRSNHSWLSIIQPPPLPPSNLSQPITPQSCLSPPFHYSHLTGQKIRVTLGGPPLLSLPLFLLPPCVFLFLTHYSQFTGWYMEGDTGPIQSLVPVSHSDFQSAAASHLWLYPSAGLSLCLLHFTPPLASFATHNFLFPHLSLLFSIYLSFFKLTSDFLKSCVSLGRCFKMALFCWDAFIVQLCQLKKSILQKVKKNVFCR